MSKNRFSVETYIKFFNFYDGGMSFQKILSQLNFAMHVRDIREKYHMYKSNGIDSLIPQKHNNHYSKELKNKLFLNISIRGYLLDS